MKMKFFPPFHDEGEVVASWGQAQLIKYLDVMPRSAQRMAKLN
jgi:hypothetical protein